MTSMLRAGLALSQIVALALAANAHQADQQRPVSTAKQMLDVRNMPRPIPIHDSVWIEDLTMMEVRDLIKGGKTTALVLTGGIEENGPYVTTGKHTHILKAMGESIARSLGNALVVPIVTLEPGNPVDRNLSPGTVVLSHATYRSVLTDIANSLRSHGFSDVVFLGDSGGNQKPMQQIVEALNAEWKSEGAFAYFIREYYNYPEVAKFTSEVLGIRETFEGYHNSYYISALVATIDTDAIRMPERITAGKFNVNGVSLAPIETTIEHGRRLVQFRTTITVAAIKNAMTAARK